MAMPAVAGKIACNCGPCCVAVMTTEGGHHSFGSGGSRGRGLWFATPRVT